MNPTQSLYAGIKPSTSIDNLKNKLKIAAKYSPAALLIGAVPAQAQIICEAGGPVGPLTMPSTSGSNSLSINMDGQGSMEFYLYGFQSSSSQFFSIHPTQGSVARTASNNLRKFAANSVIGATGSFASSRFRNIQGESSSGSSFGPFSPTPSSGFIGVRFDISGATHYGWIQVSIDATGNQLTVDGYCYEATAGRSIRAGDRGAVAAETIPTLGEWGLINLALIILTFGVVRIREGRLTMAIPGRKRQN